MKRAEATPPIKKMMAAGVPVGAGTDATRVASYNPWVSLSWLVTGRTVGGTRLYPPQNRMDRVEALRLWTESNTWFSREQGKKGRIAVGELADLAVLSADYLSVAEDEIAHRGIVQPGIDLLTKPFEPAALAARVRRALDRHERLRAGETA